MAELSLDANAVNFMIWRYLQEAGFADAASQLQKDWCFEPMLLPIAQAISEHQLVTLCYQGLLYRKLTKSLDDQRQEVPAKRESTRVPFRWSEASHPKYSSSPRPFDSIARTNLLRQAPVGPRNTDRPRSHRTQTTPNGISRRDEGSRNQEREPARKRRKTSVPAHSRDGTDELPQELDIPRPRAAATGSPREHSIPRIEVIDRAVQGDDIPVLDYQQKGVIYPRAGGLDSTAWVPGYSSHEENDHGSQLVSIAQGSNQSTLDISQPNSEDPDAPLLLRAHPVDKHPLADTDYELVACQDRQNLVALSTFEGLLTIKDSEGHRDYLHCPPDFIVMGLRWHPFSPLLLVFGIQSDETDDAESPPPSRQKPLLLLFDLTLRETSRITSTHHDLTFIGDDGSVVVDVCFSTAKGYDNTAIVATEGQVYLVDMTTETPTPLGPPNRNKGSTILLRPSPMVGLCQIIAILNGSSSVRLAVLPSQSDVLQAPFVEHELGLIPSPETIFNAQWRHLLEASQTLDLVTVTRGGLITVWRVSLTMSESGICEELSSRPAVQLNSSFISTNWYFSSNPELVSMGISRKGRYLATAYEGASLLIWDLQNAELNGNRRPLGVWKPIEDDKSHHESGYDEDWIEWSPNERYLAYKMSSEVAIIPFSQPQDP